VVSLSVFSAESIIAKAAHLHGQLVDKLLPSLRLIAQLRAFGGSPGYQIVVLVVKVLQTPHRQAGVVV